MFGKLIALAIWATLIVLLIGSITGCTVKIDIPTIDEAKLQCRYHKGLNFFFTSDVDEHPTKIVCNDGTVITNWEKNK